MKRIRLTIFAASFLFFAQMLNAAVYYRLSYDASSQTYTVAIRSTVAYSGAMARITNSTQFSIVAPDPDGSGPMAFAVTNLTNLTGLQWGQSQINSPVENPVKDYLFFAPANSGTYTPFNIPFNTWVDLFSFQTSTACIGPLYIFDNNADPLNANGSINSDNNFKTLGGGNVNLYAGNESNSVGCTCVTYKMTLDPDGQTYRVSFNSAAPFSGPFARITGSTQFTVVLPDPDGAGPGAAQITNLTSLTSLNITSSQLNNPAESPLKDYVFFAPENSGGYTLFNIPANTDIELFTFRIDGGCIGDVYLFDNHDDPLNANIVVNADNNFKTLGGGNVNLYCDNVGAPVACAICLLSNITILPENVSCNGGNDGQATAIAADGTPVYSYAWSVNTGSQTTQSAVGLAAGTYTVTVTDGLGCTGTALVTITEPAILGATALQSNVVSCFGGADGAASVNASGGTPGYTYLWSNGSSDQTATGLIANTYTVTVTDNQNCTVTAEAVVGQPAAALEATISLSDNVTCIGGADGSATISANGGTPGYSYLWSNGQSTATAISLSAGVFTVTVTDNKNCTATTSVTITEPAVGISVIISAFSDVLCNGDATGYATATASNGAEPYGYSWNTQPAQNNATAWNLPAGTYTVTVSDQNGCTASTSILIAEPAVLSAIITGQNNPTCIGGANGSATVTGLGGTAPYTFVWSTTPAQTTSAAGGLSAGIYTATVTDQNGCTATAEATIADPANDDNCACVTYRMTLDPDGQTYRVSFRSSKAYSGPFARITGSTQFTVVLPDPDGAGPETVQITNLVNLTDLDFTHSQLNSPSENPAKDYVFFAPSNSGGYTLFDIPANTYIDVFSFRIEDGCIGQVYLFDNIYDPLNANIIVNADNNFKTLGGGNVNLYCNNEGDPLACPGCQLNNITIIKENVSCFDGSDGEATAIVADGTTVYSYLWSANAGNQTTQTATNLPAGTYTVTITDGVSCTGSATVTISQPELLFASVSAHTDVSCLDGADGTATVSAFGGTSPLSYLWDNGSTDQTATGLAAGTHTVTVTDANNCTVTAEIILSEPSTALTVDVAVTNANCATSDDGSAITTPSGGTGLYDFNWSSGLNENDLAASTANGLAAGGYTLTVTDANGCSVVGAFEIADPSGVTLVVTDITPASCNNAGDGTVTVVANGGSSPYDFVWSNSQTDLDIDGPDATSTASNLVAGTYLVTVTDANGCSAIQTATIDQPTALVATIISETDETCSGNADGAATVDVTGGTTPYLYAWSAGNTPAAASNSGLAAGLYTVTITDENLCSTTVEGSISAGTALMINTLADMGPVCPGAIVPAILLSAVPNNPDIQYAWSGGAPAGLADGTSTGLNAAIPSFTSMAEGTYPVTVTATLGNCSDTETFDLIIDDAGGLHFVNCPANIMMNTDVDQCYAIVNWAPPTAIDDCVNPGNVTISGPIGGTPGSTFTTGMHTISYEATDGNGNTVTCSFTIEVMDMQTPSAVCNDITVYLNGLGTATVLSTQIGINSTDNCSGALTLSPTSTLLNCTNIGDNNIVLTVTDGNDNTSTCVATVTVVDLIPPAFTCPDPITAVCAADEQPVYTDLATFLAAPGAAADDNCALDATSFILESEADNGLSCPKTITRVYRVADQSGNTATCVQTISIDDDEAPELVGLPTEATVTGNCTGDLPVIPTVTATDNCTSPIDVEFSETITPGNCTNAYTVTRTWTAEDACGNATSFVQTISISDNEAPELVGLPTEATVTGDCTGDLPAIPTVTATDNCTSPVDVEFSETITPGNCTNAYTVTRTWTAEDACGNATSFVQTIVINDNEAPELIGLPTEATVTGNCTGDLPVIPTVTATDNCTSPIDVEFSETITPGNCTNAYTVTRTWTAEDACGNATSFVQTIVINDDEAPELVGLPTEATVTGNCTGDLPVIPTVTATDNCTSPIDVEFSETITPGNCTNAYTVTRTWTAEDACGNATSFVQTIVINDNEAPELIGLPTEASVTGDCTGDLPVIPTVTATDNCTSPIDVEFSETITPGNCTNAYTVTRTWTAEDACGNATSFVQTIVINDDEAPELVGLPTEATVTGNCTGDLPTIPTVTATDNCTSPVDVEFSETITPGNCTNAYTVTRTWTAEDACGNATSFVQTIVINDDEAPELIDLPTEATVTGDCTGDLPVIPTVTATDNCTSPVDVEFSETITPGNCTNAYTVTRTWTAEDACGNATSFVQTISIGDNEAPELIGLPTEATVTGNCTGDLPVIPTVTATDNCTSPIDVEFSETITPGNCANAYTITRTWTAEDACGNATSFVQTISIGDNEAPELIGLPTEATVTGNCTGDLPVIPTVTATDNCTSPVDVEFSETIIPGNCTNAYTVTRTWTAEDACGNATSFVQTIVIGDDEAPELIGLPTEATVTGDCTGDLPVIPTVSATDNCTSPVDVEFSETITPGNCTNAYTVTRTWTAEDACGNATSFVQTISIGDNEAPELIGLPTEATVTGNCTGDLPVIPTVTATDNCTSPVDVEFSETIIPGNCTNAYTVTRTWTAEDACGNATSFVQTISIGDNEAPELIGLPTEATVTGNCTGDLPTIPTVTATDNCTSPVDVEFSETITPGNCTNSYTVTRTWTAEDACGNATSFVQTIVINDNEAPELIGLPTEATVTGNCTGDLPVIPTVSATDNCTSPVDVEFSETITPGNCTNAYTVTRTWTAEDACGNATSFVQTISIGDNEAPELIGLPTEATVTGNCTGDLPVIPTVTATDNCTSPVDVEFSETIIPGNCTNAYTVTRTWTAEDACGNATSFVQTIVINDDEAPELVGLPTEASVDGDCTGDLPVIPTVTATDNCTSPIDVEFSETITPGNCTNAYTVTRTWTAEDACGNATSFVQTIVINDDEAPELIGLPTEATVTGNCTGDLPVIPTVTATDNCTSPVDVEFSETITPGNCTNAYTVTRTWTAEDACGNATSFVQTISIGDNEAPELIGLPTEATVTGDCTGDLPAIPTVTATDNCTSPVDVEFSETITPGNCTNAYTVTRTWTAEDACGNATSFVQTITIGDNEAPELVGLPTEATVTGDCTGDLPAIPIVTATDNCTSPIDVEFSETITPGNCTNAYTVTRTWTAEDACGNATSFVQTIVINDNEAPELIGLPTEATVTGNCTGDLPVIPTVTATDNCTSPVDVEFSETITPGNCANAYTVTRTWTAEDACGNATSFVQTISISDNEAPELIGLPTEATVTGDCTGDLPVIPTVTATDNCTSPIDVEFSETITPGNCTNAYTVTRTWTAEDACGNATSFVQTIVINDDEAPELIGLPADAIVNVECADDVPAVPVVTATDNCTAPIDVEYFEVTVPGACTNQYQVVRTWTAEDFCGNSTIFVQTITVSDTEAPELYAKPLRRHYDCVEDVEVAPYQFATDNCDVATVEYSETTDPGNCPNSIVIERRWVAYDLCGNSSTWEQQIIVLDTIAPVFVVTPVDRTYECLDDVQGAPDQGTIATDNCGVVFVDFLETRDNDSCHNQVIIIRRWEATDLCGNKNTHWQTITVYDDEAPVLATTPTDRTYDCLEDVEAAPVQVATDNCGVVTYNFEQTENPGICLNQVVITRRWYAYDLCGNSVEHWQTITVNDNVDPVVTAPAGITLDCGDISETTDPSATVTNWLASATATDNCDQTVDITYNFDATTLDVCVGGTLTVTWTATDACGNVGTATSTITVVPDTEDPIVTAPAGITLDCGDISETTDPGATVSNWLASATATDNCDTDPTLTYNFDATTLDVCVGGTLTVTWTATDACGNVGTATSTITVVPDTEDPIVTAPAGITLDCGDISETTDPGATVTNWLESATASDNCDTDPELTYSFDVTTLDVCVGGTLTVTWTATDACGNVGTATSTITVVPDTEDPIVTAPAGITLDCGDISETTDPGATVSNWLASATASDNCDTDPELTYNFDVTTLDVCVGGTLTVTWTATDACGNVATATSTITVVPDTEDPIVTAPAGITLDCGDISETTDPSATVTNWLASATATDNCDTDPELTYNFDVTTLDVCVGGTLTVTWTATDACGNVGTATSTITVVPDTEDPIVTAPAGITLDCDDISETTDPGATVSNWLASATASDNCDTDPELTYNFDVTTLDVCVGGTLTVTWTATDACGNVGTATSTITVVPDTEDPIVTAPAGITLDCGDISETTDPSATVTNWLASATASDNCDTDPTLTYNFDATMLDVCVGGTLTVTWTSTDACGNVGTATSTITVVPDTEDPIVTAPAGITLDCGDISGTTDPSATVSNWLASATATDNCDTDPTLTYNFDATTLNVCVGGTLTVTWTATDACGNTATATSTITVVPDTEAPAMTCPAPATAQCSVDEIPVYDNLAEFNTAGGTASDNCGLNTGLFGLLSQTQNGNVYTRTYRVTDNCGNTTTCTQTITVLDTEIPTFVNCPANITVGNDVDKCGANVVFSTPIAEDNCQIVTVTQTAGLASGSLFPVGTTTVTFTAVDQTGNSTICQFTIEVMDMQTPTAVCQDLTIFLNGQGLANAAAVMIGGNSTDNCPGALSLTLSQLIFDCSQIGDNNITLTATDLAGNTSTCVSTVTVQDIMKPTFTCPAAQTTNSCDALVPDLVAQITDAADNCGIASITQNPVAGSDFGNASGQTIIVTITVTDVNGNVATCAVPVSIVDNVPPVFVNCPTTMIMIGNDPDQCSGKLNWSIPVATDNCTLLSVVQIAGPASGTVVPVGQPQTITYRAFDAAGNSSTCVFQIQVVDTQKPELDDDILMPGDVTVECDAVPAPFVLTTADVNDNCTPSAQLLIAFTEVRTNGNCPFNYVLTRTWTITDAAGNQRIHVQKVTVRDTKAPVAICKAATVTLDKFGNATITAADVNNGSTDNCTAQANLTLSVSPSAFTCANLGANVVTLTVTDQCGNASTCTAIVTVQEGIGACTPQFSVKTTCMNNATDLDNGQFMDVITVRAVAGQTWTLTAGTGLFATTSAAPPAAPTALTNGTALVMGSADGIDNDGDGTTDEADEMIYYTLKGLHVDAVGYAVTIGNSQGQTGTISNKGYYPSPYFKNLYDPFCIETEPFVIEVGEYNNAQGVVTQIMVNGVATNIFDAKALGLGFHTVMATFDAGSATTNLVINGQLVGGTDAQAQADPGCQQKITKVIQIVNTPTVVVCNDLVYVSLDADCVEDITPDQVLEGTYACFDDYSVVLTYPNGTNTYNPANRVDATHIGKFLNYTLVHATTGNMCWGQIKVEDKLAPILDCPADITVACSESTEVFHTGNVGIDDCSTTTTQLDDDILDNGDCSSPRAIITRTFFVTDKWGNQAACTQTITVIPFDLNDVVFPADITVNCESVYLNPAATAPANAGAPSINGASIVGSVLCDAKVNFTDTYFDGCEGTYTILRTWSVLSDCLPVGSNNPVTKVQRIEVEDKAGPQFACPGDVTVSVDPFGCCATAALPDMIVSEGCSSIKTLEAKVTGTDPATGNVITFTVQGHLGDFAGNNYWHPDTLAIFPYTQCLPMGVYTVRYTAEDGCGNTSSCEFQMTVADLVPPVSACDEFTQVALGGNGEAFVNAATFDDGSYDNCAPVTFKARRMNANDCQTDTVFHDQVKFCCDDINDTILVVFRVYDVPVQPGVVGLEEYEGHYNDCMVQVFVEDKIKPICTAPAHVTVSCENFDPSLWAYGFATATDNCCIDTITATNNLGLFDTVCNKGTITRTFRAIDCGGQSSTCTQRIIVNYEQDYYVRFPNDVIVTVCDGTGNYGEPTFFGEDCELLGVSHEDEIFTVVPDACFKIERTWTIINWCTYNPNLGCIEVPNPNPNATVNHPSNLPGPIVSAPGTAAPWAPTVVAINPGATPTNYSTFWNANANCYKYKQIIKIIDTQDPVVENCPDSTLQVCDLTPNTGELWNETYWYDATTESHNLCEAPTDLTITATDLCSGANVNFRYLLFLDLDGDGVMESVVNSTNTGIAGLGWNAVTYDNAQNPNYAGGTIRAFDERPVPANQKYGFALQVTTSGTKRTASVRWNTQQSQNTYTVPELPYGTHKIKWFIEDGCGNETVCEYPIVVKDCKKPTVVCLNGLSINIMPTKMVSLWASDFLQYTEDNCTPSNKLVIAIRKSGTVPPQAGFPTNPDGTPQTGVTFTCDELGTQLVELWSRDLAGNADYCETYVIVQDNIGVCTPGDKATVAGVLATELNKGLESASVQLEATHLSQPPVSLFMKSDVNGIYGFPNAMPFGSDYTVTPVKDDDPLNGVSTFDLVLINKHILGLEPLNSPYKMIAADANNSRSITTFDIVELRKLILGQYSELPNNTSWRFVDEDYQFPNASNPFQDIFPETISVADVQASHFDDDFVAVKVGDVNGNVVTSSLYSVEDRTSGELLFDAQDRRVKAGETFTVDFRATEKVKGYQFTLYFPNLEVVDVKPGADMSMGNFGIFNDQHALTTSFDNEQVQGEFSITFRAKTTGQLSKMLAVSSRITKAEAYRNDAMTNNDVMTIALRFNSANGPVIAGQSFELYQNQPNPWMHRTQIGFYLPEASEATLTVYDETGRVLFGQTGDFGKGHNAFTLDKALMNTTGMLYYKVETPTDSAVKKMIQTK